MNLKTLGATCIVSGTTIGAGMLAIPLTTANIGVIPAFILLFTMWVISSYSALLMLEINLRSGIGDNVFKITGKTLGPIGQAVQTICFLWLLIALTVAYLGGGVSTLHLESFIPSHNLSILVFVIIAGGSCFFGVKMVDNVNRLLFILMIIFFLSVLAILLPHTNLSHITEEIHSSVSWSITWVDAILVTFTSFGFQICIATLVGYLGGKTVDLRKAIILGSSIPLFCYFLWVLATLGVLGSNNVILLNGKLPNLIAALQSALDSQWMQWIISGFSALAILTSFLGVTISLFDFLAELTNSNNSKLSRLKTWLLTFVPPTLFAMYVPSFTKALAIAAVPLAIMTIILPILMAFKQRPQKLGGYQVTGGSFALIILGIIGIVISGLQLYVWIDGLIKA